jgi:hypothetical protein
MTVGYKLQLVRLTIKFSVCFEKNRRMSRQRVCRNADEFQPLGARAIATVEKSCCRLLKSAEHVTIRVLLYALLIYHLNHILNVLK